MNIIEGSPGEWVGYTALRAIQKAKELDYFVVMKFNGLEIKAYPESCGSDIVEKYHLLSQLERYEK